MFVKEPSYKWSEKIASDHALKNKEVEQIISWKFDLFQLKYLFIEVSAKYNTTKNSSITITLRVPRIKGFWTELTI